jgi:hypothetical protein
MITSETRRLTLHCVDGGGPSCECPILLLWKVSLPRSEIDNAVVFDHTPAGSWSELRGLQSWQKSYTVDSPACRGAWNDHYGEERYQDHRSDWFVYIENVTKAVGEA